jgi:hypothetical protein
MSRVPAASPATSVGSNGRASEGGTTVTLLPSRRRSLNAFLSELSSSIHVCIITMTNSSDHRELFSVLGELYTLLDQLAAVPSSIAILPSPETGIHTASDFDADAAKAAGFSDEAVKVLSSMPYLDYPLELQSNAKAVTYSGMDQSDFEDVRELIAGLDGELAPPSIIKLTDSSASMGVQYMYDAETSKSICWPESGEDSSWKC